MNAPLAYLNGRLMPFAEAALPLHDAGFVSGATVVDNARTFRHKLFRWADHLERFRRDCAVCHVKLDATDAHLAATVEELIAHNARLLPAGGELQVVTFATPGPLGFYLGEAQNGPPTLGMVTYPLPLARYRKFFTDGVVLYPVPSAGAPDGIVSPTVKHRSRMAWHVADHRARAEAGNPAAVAVATHNGCLMETGIANLLVVLDGDVVTPPHETVLDGISLRVTRELCRDAGARFTEAPVSFADVERASEMLLTGTGFCLAGVRELVGGQKSGSRTFDWPGPVFTKLLAAWSALVGVDVALQFTGAN